jgi:hypothetical protein
MERDKIKDENPDENISDVTKLLGLKWKAMSKEEKQVWLINNLTCKQLLTSSKGLL